MASFDTVAAEYDAARPAYPSELYDSLEPLEGLLVVEVGAGTGIATRQLLARGASVIAVDAGRAVLEQAATRSRSLCAVLADGAVLPVRDGAADLVCSAQAWHWIDPSTRFSEARRVLRPGGRWAAWWSHARADGERWFDRCWSIVERACPGVHRTQRDVDWAGDLEASGCFRLDERVVVPWTRETTLEEWIADQATHSYVIGLPAPQRQRLLRDVRSVLQESFDDRPMAVPYETRLWIAKGR